MEVRAFEQADIAACLAIFDSNVPEYLTPAQQGDFEVFLRNPAGPYFVMEHEGGAIGCGGYLYSPGTGVARLVWGMIKAQFQRQGLGRYLLLYRLREISRSAPASQVQLTTAEKAAGFFLKQGFRTLAQSPDGQVEMSKRMVVCA